MTEMKLIVTSPMWLCHWLLMKTKHVNYPLFHFCVPYTRIKVWGTLNAFTSFAFTFNRWELGFCLFNISVLAIRDIDTKYEPRRSI